MKAFLPFFRNFLALAFRGKASIPIHFGVPMAGFAAMFFLLSATESKAFAARQAIGLVFYYIAIQAVMIVSQTVKDREIGVSARIRVSPAARGAYLAGCGAAATLILVLQAASFSLFVAIFSGNFSGFTFSGLAPVLLAYSVACVGFAFLVCALSSTATSAVMAANLAAMVSSLLGGAFFPVEFMGEGLKATAFVFPQFWAMKAVSLAATASPFADRAGSLAVLLLFGSLFLSLAWVSSRFSPEKG